jgi:hypothetical protein
VRQAVALSGKREGGAGGLRDLNLSNNVVDIQGAYMLAGGLESNCVLERLVLDHNFLTQTGARAVQMAGVRPEHVMQISMLECGISQRNAAHFDPTEPGGLYKLDLSTEYSRHVVKALVRVVLAGNGLFMPSPPLTINGKLYKKFWVSRPKTAIAQGSQSPGGGARGAGGAGEGSPAAVQAALACLPEKGILEFTFGSLYKPPAIGAKLATQLHEKLLRELSNSNLTVPGIRDVLVSVLHGNVLTCQQVSELLTLNNDAEYRLTVLHAVFNKISDPQHRPALLAATSSPAERQRLKQQVGAACWVFSALNPTGHYSLNLNRPMQRELALALMAFNNQEKILEDEILKQAQHRVGGPRDKSLARTWRNSKLDNEPFAYSNTRALPRNGTLVVDFVQISKPSYSKEDITVMPNENLVNLVRVYGDPWHKDPASLVEQVREESNMYFFTCDMVQYLLLELTKCIVIRNMFAEKVQKVTGIHILQRWMNKAMAMCFTMWRMGIILQLKRIPSLQEAGMCYSLN